MDTIVLSVAMYFITFSFVLKDVLAKYVVYSYNTNQTLNSNIPYTWYSLVII